MRHYSVIQKTIGLGLVSFALIAPSFGLAQDSVVLGPELPTKTITATLPATKPQRVLELLWQEGRQNCSDKITLSASREQVVMGDNVVFRTRIRRNCGASPRNAPVPIKALFLVRNLDSKSDRAEASQELQPSSSSFSFEYQFKKAQRYLISVILYYTEAETHTINLRLNVLKP